MTFYHKIVASVIAVCVLTACSDNDDIIAEVGDKKISQQQFDAYLTIKRIPKQNDSQVQQQLGQYLEREALAAAISQQKGVDQTSIDAEINEYIKQLKISRYFESYLKDKVSEDAIRNYYNTHSDDYSKRRARVAHILIRTTNSATEVERQSQLSRAHEAYSQAITGSRFEDVAKNYSEDKRSSAKGGDLGWLAEGAVDAVFSQTAFDLQEGEISEPFATSFGFHVVKLLEAPKIVQTPYEKVKGDIRYQLRQAAKKAETERLQQQIKTTVK